MAIRRSRFPPSSQPYHRIFYNRIFDQGSHLSWRAHGVNSYAALPAVSDPPQGRPNRGGPYAGPSSQAPAPNSGFCLKVGEWRPPRRRDRVEGLCSAIPKAARLLPRVGSAGGSSSRYGSRCCVWTFARIKGETEPAHSAAEKSAACAVTCGRNLRLRFGYSTAQPPTPRGIAAFSRPDIECQAKVSATRDLVAERVGFEPTVRCRTHAFQACALSHSAISPRRGRAHDPPRFLLSTYTAARSARGPRARGELQKRAPAAQPFVA